MNSCPWVSQSGNQCQKIPSDGNIYCKVHKSYEGKFDPKNLSSVKFCTRCKSPFVPNMITNSQCEKCLVSKGRDKQCGWINQKGEPCPWKSLTECLYCKRHSKYEGVYVPDDIPSLSQCSGCKNMFKPNGQTKTCDICVTRSRATNERIKIYNESKHKCCAIVQRTGLQCTHIPITDSDYCGEHQSYGKMKMLTENGITVCSNWIRGCWNNCTNGYKRCDTCRAEERIKDTHRLTKRRHITQQNELDRDNDRLTCVRCSETKQKEYFEASRVEYTPDGIIPIYCKECDTCRSNARNKDQRSRSDRVDMRTKSDRKKTYNFRLNSRYDMYKYRDHQKCLIPKELFEKFLPRQFAYKIMSMPCIYCQYTPVDDLPNGLDRIDNTKGHILGNVLPCCLRCNMMKGSMSYTSTISKMTDIVKNKRAYCLTMKHHAECPF